MLDLESLEVFEAETGTRICSPRKKKSDEGNCTWQCIHGSVFELILRTSSSIRGHPKDGMQPPAGDRLDQQKALAERI